MITVSYHSRLPTLRVANCDAINSAISAAIFVRIIYFNHGQIESISLLA